MSDTTVPLPISDGWNYRCSRCGCQIYVGIPHTCPPGIYDQGAPQFPVGWPTPDYGAVLERIAVALESIAARGNA